MKNRAGAKRWSCLAAMSLAVAVGGCAGGPHRRGEHQLTLTDDIRWLTGYRLRHLSHGHILHGKNPGEDDQEVYVGLAFSIT